MANYLSKQDKIILKILKKSNLPKAKNLDKSIKYTAKKLGYKVNKNFISGIKEKITDTQYKDKLILDTTKNTGNNKLLSRLSSNTKKMLKGRISSLKNLKSLKNKSETHLRLKAIKSIRNKKFFLPIYKQNYQKELRENDIIKGSIGSDEMWAEFNKQKSGKVLSEQEKKLLRKKKQLYKKAKKKVVQRNIEEWFSTFLK